MNSIVIDNCVVFKFMGNGICIRPISLAKKMNPELNIGSLPKISYGDRIKDNKVISRLADGTLKFEDLLNV